MLTTTTRQEERDHPGKGMLHLFRYKNKHTYFDEEMEGRDYRLDFLEKYVTPGLPDHMLDLKSPVPNAIFEFAKGCIACYDEMDMAIMQRPIRKEDNWPLLCSIPEEGGEINHYDFVRRKGYLTRGRERERTYPHPYHTEKHIPERKGEKHTEEIMVNKQRIRQVLLEHSEYYLREEQRKQEAEEYNEDEAWNGMGVL